MASIGKGLLFLILFVMWWVCIIITGMFLFRPIENNVDKEDEWRYSDYS